VLPVLFLAAGIAAAPTPSAATPAGQLHGAVAYGRHVFAVGAVVMVRPEGSATPLLLATTGESGAFAFDHLPDGVYRAEIRRDGYVPVVKSGIPVKAPFRAVVEVSLLHGDAPPAVPASPAAPGDAAVAGIARLVGGGVLAEARVRLVRADGTDDPRTAITAADGTFAFSGLRPGDWRLEILGAGLLPLRAGVELAGEVALEAALAPQPANYRPPAQDLIVPEEVLPPPGW
jgi:hypothetical protein